MSSVNLVFLFTNLEQYRRYVLSNPTCYNVAICKTTIPSLKYNVQYPTTHLFDRFTGKNGIITTYIFVNIKITTFQDIAVR